MVRILMLALLTCLVGCGPSIREMGAPSATNGKVTLKGQPLGDISVTLQPMTEGYPKTVQVAAEGTFQTELVPGKYVYSIGLSPSKTSEQALKKVDPKYYDTSMDRSVVVAAGEELIIALD
jgi:ABC-type phosphate transport system substrate-binding protein